jgi:ATP-dependent protease HslVU (ClpYQ) ATPase subunit
MFCQDVWKMNNSAIGSSFESFLEEEDIKKEVETNAVKRIIALQMRENLKQENITKTELAAHLETSRAAIDRLLDPYDIKSENFTPSSLG